MDRFDIYTPVALTADLAGLSAAQQDMVRLLIEAADITDGLFWQQVWGDKEALLTSSQGPSV